MSNYGTSYNINQTGDLYAVQDYGTGAGLSKYNSARGTTVNSPLNYRTLKLFKGYDNEFFFFVKDQDRKPLNLQGMKIRANLIFRENGSRVVSTTAQVIDFELATIRVVISSKSITNLDLGYCDLVLSYEKDGLVLPLFTDLNNRPGFSVECTDSAGYIPLNSQEVTRFIQTPEVEDMYVGSYIHGPKYYKKPAGLVTLGAYTTNYTGNFYIQGTLSPSPANDDWFFIELGVQTYFYRFDNFTGIEPFNFVSNLYYLRPVFSVEHGTVDKLVVRL
jgi:hypothetical protein